MNLLGVVAGLLSPPLAPQGACVPPAPPTPVFLLKSRLFCFYQVLNIITLLMNPQPPPFVILKSSWELQVLFCPFSLLEIQQP